MATIREEMILKNMPLVGFVIGKMTDQSASQVFDREEAVAYGVEGLIQAVDHYDPERGTTFASYAIQRIRGSVLDAIRRIDVLPRSLRRSTREVERANLELAAVLGRWPTARELAFRLGIGVDEVRQALANSSARVVSLEKMMTDRATEGASAWEVCDEDELADPAAQTDRLGDLQMLNHAIETLPERERTIVELRYGHDMSFLEIARAVNLSESRVCQLHKRIICSLRDELKKELVAAA